VVPAHRQKEIRNFVESELSDFSISRLTEKMPWGVPVPGDEKHCMYVWFDALTYYISSLGWPSSAKATAGKPNKFERFWGTVDKPNALQIAGKDNLRQQSAMWQAMLMAANLPSSRQIFIHGFITSGGQKMSKSLGNVIDPFEYVQNYSTDALRYYLLAKINPFEDCDFTKEGFEERYQADLANGLGNLVARVAKLAESSDLEFPTKENDENVYREAQKKSLEDYRFDLVLNSIWTTNVSAIDKHLNQETPWTRKGNQLKQVLEYEVEEIRKLAKKLKPFLPETAEKIEKQFKGPKIKSEKSLFPRLA